MEYILLFVAVVAIVISAIIIASFISREKPDDPPDQATGSNKPDDRNAFGPKGKN